MKIRMTAAAAMAAMLLTGACSGGAGNNGAGANAAAGNEAAAPADATANTIANSTAGAPAANGAAANAGGPANATETVRQVANCVLETPEGRYSGACERVEWGGPSFSIRRAGGAAFYAGVTEAVVEVDRPGEAAGGSYRNGGELVSAGPLTFRSDCACWARPNMRVGAQ